MNPNTQQPPNANQPKPMGSIDGFRPSTPQTPPSSPVAPNPSPASNIPGSFSSSPGITSPDMPKTNDMGSRAQAGQQILNSLPDKSPKGGGGSRAILTVFIILFVLAAGGAGYLYWQYDAVKQDLNDEKATTTSLTNQLSETQSSAAEQASELQTKNEYITEIGDTVDNLQVLCGDACSGVTIPTLTTTTDTNEE